MSRTAVPSEPAAPTAVDLLRATVVGMRPLQALDPSEYALGHSLFEARSTQRAQLTAWLVRRLAARASTPSRVLSIGCGDGTVDVRLAAALAAKGQRVDYVGVEPYRPSGRAFTARMADVAGVNAAVLPRTFDDARPAGRYDVVLAVHSLYYVDDLAATLRRACALLAPGGELVILHAPYEPLNVYVRLLSPGRRQGFSDEVVAAIHALGRRPQLTRIDAELDLTGTGVAGTDRRLLEFTVQARLPASLRPVVRAALTAQARYGPGLVVAHPVDAVVVQL